MFPERPGHQTQVLYPVMRVFVVNHNAHMFSLIKTFIYMCDNSLWIAQQRLDQSEIHHNQHQVVCPQSVPGYWSQTLNEAPQPQDLLPLPHALQHL